MSHTLRPMRRTAIVTLLTCVGVTGTAHAQSRDTGAPAGILSCPIEQTPIKNGARPNAELFRKLLRCKKGELAVAAGEEGAVHVDVTALQVGAARPWSYRQDTGSGRVGTMVYPVRATYAVRTYYRAATEVSEGWVRVLNFYVDAFGEWQIGSEEPVRSPTVRRIPRG